MLHRHFSASPPSITASDDPTWSPRGGSVDVLGDVVDLYLRTPSHERGEIRAVIDRDIDLDVRRTLEILLHADGRLDKDEISAPQVPQIYIRENAHPRVFDA